MPLTKEQFQKARSSGFTTEQIIGFEKRRETEQSPQNPFSSPEEAFTALDKAKREQRITESEASPLGVVSKGLDMATEPMVNSYLFGLPDLISKKVTGKSYIPEDSQMTGLSSAAGMFGGGSTAVAGRIGKMIAGKTLGKRLIRGAAEGASYGATQVMNSDAKISELPQKQAGQALAGGVLGAGVGAVATGASKIMRGVRKLKQKSTRLQPLQELSKQKKDVRELYGEQISQAKTESDEILNTTKERFKNDIKILDEQMNEISETTSADVQPKLIKYFKDNSKKYGEIRDQVADDLTKSGQDITRSEADEIIGQTLNELNESFITEGQPREIIELLKKKYASQIIDEAGNIIDKSDEAIDFRKLHEDIKAVRASMTAGAKSGNQRLTQEDIAAAILDKNFGNLIAKRVPKFAELQKSYAPVIQNMKKANQIFKPRKGEFDTKMGTNLVKRFGLKKTEAGEERFISELEKGSESFPGVGNFTSKAKIKGEELIRTKENVSPTLKSIRDTAIQKEAAINKELTDRLKRLGFRENKIRLLLQDKEKKRKLVENIGRTAGYTALGLGILQGIKYLKR